jgi:hypothetical protein
MEFEGALVIEIDDHEVEGGFYGACVGAWAYD